MNIFEDDKVARKKTPKDRTEDLLKKLTAQCESAAQEWLKEHFYGTQQTFEESVAGYVSEVLRDLLQGAVEAKMGLEVSFGETRVKYDSPLYHQIEEYAANHAASVLKAVFDKMEKGIVKKIPSKILRAVQKTYQDAFLEALYDKARDMGIARANADADKILAKALGSIKLPSDG